MTGSAARFAWYRFQTTFRSRIGGYLTIVFLVGLIGGVAIGAIAGARRTQAAFPASLAKSNASDLQFQSYIGGCKQLLECLYSRRFTQEIAGLPHVQRVAGYVNMYLAPIGHNGHPYLPYALQNNTVSTIGSFGGEYFSQDRVTADEGHVPNPYKIDEFAITAETEHALGWHVGQEIPMAAYSFAQLLTSQGLPKHSVARFDMKLVGIVAFDGAVVHDEVDRYPTFALFTPALASRIVKDGGAGFSEYALKLDGGTRYLSAVERELIGILPRGSEYQFHVTAVDEAEVERATKPESIALGAFGAIAGLAALVIAGQAIARAARRNLRDLEILRAFGTDPLMIAADSLLGPFMAILVGALLATVVGLAVTPLSPIAAVRQVDPSPGLDFDWAVIAGGFAVLLVILSVAAAAYVMLSMRRSAGRQIQPSSEDSSRIVESASRAGLPPSAIAGLRFAVSRGRGRDAAPVGSAFVGASLAVAVLVTTITFASGLGTLVSHPELYGWNWNYAIVQAGSGNVPGELTNRLLRNDRYVASWTGFGFANFQVDGISVPGMLTTSRASISPPILSGHRIEGTDQIVLGGATLAELHKRVGQFVVVSYGDLKDAPAYVPPTRVRIVGTATFPAIGDSGSLHPTMGAGALISRSIAPPALQNANKSSDPLQNGQAIYVIRLHKGAPTQAARRSLDRVVATITKRYQADPNSGGGTFELLSVQQPAEIVNYKTIGNTPAALAGALAAASALALGLALAASVRRRRRDLALLKSLGFVRRQLTAVVFWQASIAALVGVVIGVPLGIIFGRLLWNVFAREIYAVPHSTIPSLEVVLVAVGTLLLANAVAFLPARVAAETPIAPILRSE